MAEAGCAILGGFNGFIAGAGNGAGVAARSQQDRRAVTVCSVGMAARDGRNCEARAICGAGATVHGDACGVGSLWILTRNQPSEVRGQEPQVRRPKAGLPHWVGVLLLLGLVVELPVHSRYMETLAELPFYRAFESLAGEPAGGLMELPFATQQSETTGRRMLLQTVHNKPIMAGYLARRYDSPIINSCCSAFWGFISPLDVPREDIASPLVVNSPLAVLHFYGIKYIALYDSFSGSNDSVDPEQLEALRSLVTQNTLSQVYSDTHLSISRVRLEGEDGDRQLSPAPSFHVGAGWYPVEQSEGEPFRWVKDGLASLCLFTPIETTGSLTMQGTAFAQERGVRVSVGEEVLYDGKLPAGAFTPIETTTRTWNEGVTQIDISAPEAGTSPSALDANSGDNRSLTVGFKDVKLENKPKR